MKRFDDQSIRWMVEELEGRGYKVEPPKEETVDDLAFPVFWIGYDDPNNPFAYPPHHYHKGSDKTPWSHASIWNTTKLVAPVGDVMRYLENRLEQRRAEDEHWWKQLNDDEEYIHELF
jgi:hypothetical protein